MAKFKKNNLTFNESIAKSKEHAKSQIDGLIHFSFKYLDCKPEKFNYNLNDSSYFITLISRLKDISTIRAVDFLSNTSKSLRAHPIKWGDTTETCFNIPAEEQLVDVPYQFSLSSNEYGRVHGFIVNTTRFYVVWLDKSHDLYPGA